MVKIHGEIPLCWARSVPGASRDGPHDQHGAGLRARQAGRQARRCGEDFLRFFLRFYVKALSL